MAETWIPQAARVPGPAWKQGYGWIPRRSNAQIEGDVKHSAEGSYTNALGVLNGPRQASWTFTVPRNSLANGVRYAQHYPLESITWHVGLAGDADPATDIRGNIALIGIEHAGFAGQTLTPHQIAVTIEISQFLRDHTRAGLDPPQLRVNLFEHRWMKPTACPSGRIPWAPIIAGLQPAPPPPPPPPPPPQEVKEMILVKTSNDNRVFAFDGATFSHIPGGAFAEAAWGHDWATKVQTIPHASKKDPRHPYGDASLPVFYPRGSASE